ncbi:MAG: hypothetical protein K6G28_00355, partial [Acholeplasmatales bacterium]|nr:hypothetical protein [Acholeplasmatales bacterium]
MDFKKDIVKWFFGSDDKDFFIYYNKVISGINGKTVKYLTILSFLFCAFLSLIYLVPEDTIKISIFYLINSFIFG